MKVNCVVNTVVQFARVSPLFLFASILLSNAAAPSPAFAQGGRAAPVSVSPVIARQVTSKQTFIGTVTPTRRAVVGSAVDGRVQELFVDDGDSVKMIDETLVVDGKEMKVKVGQPLAQLRVKTIGIEIAAARAQLELAQHELTQLRASLPEEIAQAEAKLRGTEALKNFAKAKYTRVDNLYKRGSSISKEQLEEAYSGWIAAEQNFLGAESALKELNETREVRESQAKSRVLIRQEEVNRLEDRKAKYTIRAPFDGVVVAKDTEVGSWISSGDPVAEVVELDPVEITVVVPEIYIAELEAAMEQPSPMGSQPSIEVRLDAFPHRQFKAEYHRTVPDADIRSRTYPVQLRLANERRGNGYAIKPGMLARVTLPVGGQRRVTLVPKDALVLGGPKPVVFVVAQGMARMVTVDTGVSIGSLIEVSGNLEAGAKVVVEGNERLRPGPVKILKEIPAE